MTTTYPDPVDLLQALVRFDTTNPPGNEAAAIHYLAEQLCVGGLSPTVVGPDEQRLSLVARLPGRGEAPPIMLEGHMDVVSTRDQPWTHPPFAAEMIGDVLWGRGTLDDKGAVAIMTTAVLRAQAEAYRPPGDVLLVVVADEETGGTQGAQYLVEQHAEQFAGVRYGIGEGGGYSVMMGGRKFYPIMLGEKQICTVRVTIRGKSGHGASPVHGEAMAKLGALLQRLDRQRLPVHINPVVRQMLEALRRALPLPQRALLGLLRYPALTDRVLDLLGEQGKQFDPLLHNTVSPTIVRGGEKFNVIPGQITLDLDGRLLPNFTPQDMLRELTALLGDEVELRVVGHQPGPPLADMSHYGVLAELLREVDPQGTPVPFVVGGGTDARHFARLGIQLYGFIPFDLPDGLIDTVHAADERVPVAAVRQGAATMYQLLQRFHG